MGLHQRGSQALTHGYSQFVVFQSKPEWTGRESQKPDARSLCPYNRQPSAGVLFWGCFNKSIVLAGANLVISGPLLTRQCDRRWCRSVKSLPAAQSQSDVANRAAGSMARIKVCSTASEQRRADGASCVALICPIPLHFTGSCACIVHTLHVLQFVIHARWKRFEDEIVERCCNRDAKQGAQRTMYCRPETESEFRKM